MEQIRKTTALSRLFYGLLIFAWVLALASVAVVLYDLFPPAERRVTESFAAADAHRPAEAYRYLRYQDKMEAYQPYLEALAGGEYEAVFLSMYSLESFEEEDFRSYRGVPTLKIEPVFENSLELLEALKRLLSCDALPERIYLGIDPVKLERHLVWEEDLDWQGTIAAMVREHEEISWEVLLAYPSLAEWQQQPEAAQKQGVAGYERAMEALAPLENLLLFYIGGQEWLICNQDNYAGEGTLNASVTHTLMLNIFCDQYYAVTGDNRKDMLKELEETLDRWQHDPPFVKERTDDTLVFLGDSIFGNYKDSASVPGVVANFTGAKCINCGYGGICLSVGNGGVAGVEVIANLCDGQTGDIPEGVAAYSGIQDFAQSGSGGGRLMFLLNYGINDYIQGHPVESEDKYAVTTYMGAMRTGIEQLQAIYPGAEIVVLTPGYITYRDNGTQVDGESGGVLAEYMEAAVKAAQEYGLPYMNIYEELETCAAEDNLLEKDGIHLNEKGRFYLGMLICGKLNDMVR